MKKKVSLGQSILWIFSSAIIINALAFMSIKGYQYWKKKSNVDLKKPIRAIVQTGPQREALKTPYLAQLLGLCADRPVLSTEFDLKKGREKLLASPVIRDAELKMPEPGILYIDYTIRQPIAFLYDFENIALDEERYPFPLTPFFTPKKLPEIYLGLETTIEWNQPITGEKIDLAYQILKIITGPIVGDLFNIQRIDVSNAFESSLGRREIVLITQDEIYTNFRGREIHFVLPRTLRLSTKTYSQELSNYLKLREQLLEKEKLEFIYPEGDETLVMCPQKTIDFRIPQLAFIEEEN